MVHLRQKIAPECPNQALPFLKAATRGGAMQIPAGS